MIYIVFQKRFRKLKKIPKYSERSNFYTENHNKNPFTQSNMWAIAQSYILLQPEHWFLCRTITIIKIFEQNFQPSYVWSVRISRDLVEMTLSVSNEDYAKHYIFQNAVDIQYHWLEYCVFLNTFRDIIEFQTNQRKCWKCR